MKESGPNEGDADDMGAQDMEKSWSFLNGKPGAVSNSCFSFSHPYLLEEQGFSVRCIRKVMLFEILALFLFSHFCTNSQDKSPNFHKNFKATCITFRFSGWK